MTSTLARRGTPSWVLGGAGLLGLVLLLELLPRSGVVPETSLPPASRIGASLVEQAGTAEFWQAVRDTLTGWATGFGIAFVAAVAVGVALGSSRLLREVTASTVEFLRPIPSVALVPLVVLVFGTDMRSTVLLVVYATFWQVLIQVLYGVQDVDPVAMDTARSFRMGLWARTRHVLWPTALPYVMTGARLGAAVALILAVTGELVIGSPGLGRQISLSQSAGAVEPLYALVVVTGLIGVAINLAARAVERRVLAWHPSVRRDVAA